MLPFASGLIRPNHPVANYLNNFLLLPTLATEHIKMALIGTLRNKMGKIVVGAIMLTMLAFIFTEFIGNFSGGNQNPDIAKIAGEEITNSNFQSEVDELSRTFAFNTGRNPDQDEINQIRDQAWNALILKSAYQNQFDELGLVITDTELVDMVQGNNISPEIRSFFTDPETGQFSKDNVTNFLASISQAPPRQQATWISFEASLTPSRLVNKYQTLMAKTNYVTKYEAKEEYTSQNANATLEYLYIPYLSMSDSSISATDSELEKYLRDNKEEYEREESRNIEYITFDLTPSPEDSSVMKQEIVSLKDDLMNATNDSSFVAINSDDPYSFVTYQIDDLPAQVRDGGNVREVGYVSEPEIVNGNYEFFKLSQIDTVTQDSILYRVAKIKKDFFISDETINATYRDADLFVASAGNTEEFRKNAEAQGYSVLKANDVGKHADRVGIINDGRSIILWLYNDAEKGAVSKVKEIKDQYIVATMTGIQEKGLANLETVRNQVTTLVKNEKKGDIIADKLNSIVSNDLNEIATSYGDGAKTGDADVQLFSNDISTIGYAPNVVGLTFALNEEENAKAVKVKDGVVMVKVITKDTPVDQEDYSSYALQVVQKRSRFTSLIADFPFTYFKVYVSRDIDDAIKEFADIEDMRHKFF